VRKKGERGRGVTTKKVHVSTTTFRSALGLKGGGEKRLLLGGFRTTSDRISSSSSYDDFVPGKEKNLGERGKRLLLAIYRVLIKPLVYEGEKGTKKRFSVRRGGGLLCLLTT